MSPVGSGGAGSGGSGRESESGSGSGPAAGDRHAEADATLSRLRARILELDEELVRLVGERRDLVLEVGDLKRELERPVMDPAREAEVVRRAARLARDAGVDEEMVRDIVWRIIAAARAAQEGRSSWGPPEEGPPS